MSRHDAQHDWFYTRYISVETSFSRRPRLVGRAIVTLPFSVLLPNQTGSISLLINFSKATCSVYMGWLRGYQQLESWFSQKCWPVFFFSPFFLVDVSFGWVWLNSTHLFFFFNAPVAVLSSGGISGLKAIRFGYLEFRWNALDEGGNGKYLFLKLLCIIYAFDFIFFTFSNFSKQVFSQVLIN